MVVSEDDQSVLSLAELVRLDTPMISIDACQAIMPTESAELCVAAKDGPEVAWVVTASAIGSVRVGEAVVEAVMMEAVDVAAMAERLAAAGAANCSELIVASVAIAAARVSGFPEASEAAMVTMAGAPAVPPITKLD